jgi:hypothetical protein
VIQRVGGVVDDWRERAQAPVDVIAQVVRPAARVEAALERAAEAEARLGREAVALAEATNMPNMRAALGRVGPVGWAPLAALLLRQARVRGLPG